MSENPGSPSSVNESEEIDIDLIFDQLENEDDSSIREQRLEQLQREYSPAFRFVDFC